MSELKPKEQEIVAVVQEAVRKHGVTREAIIPVLEEVNRAFGYIPVEALAEIRRNAHKPEEGLFLSDGQIFSIASFYQMLSLKPLGRHVIRFCESAPCHVRGGRQVLQAIKSEVGINPGETSPDKKWSLLMTSCLGLCDIGVVFLVDDDIHGNVTPERVHEILSSYP